MGLTGKENTSREGVLKLLEMGCSVQSRAQTPGNSDAVYTGLLRELGRRIPCGQACLDG